VTADGIEEYRKELRELQVVDQTMVESIGSSEESEGSLADRLRVVPQKFAQYLAGTSRNCVAQALGLVKLYWPWCKDHRGVRP